MMEKIALTQKRKLSIYERVLQCYFKVDLNHAAELDAFLMTIKEKQPNSLTIAYLDVYKESIVRLNNDGFVFTPILGTKDNTLITSLGLLHLAKGGYTSQVLEPTYKQVTLIISTLSFVISVIALVVSFLRN